MRILFVHCCCRYHYSHRWRSVNVLLFILSLGEFGSLAFAFYDTIFGWNNYRTSHRSWRIASRSGHISAFGFKQMHARKDDSTFFHHLEDNIDRVFCLSDLHTDHVDNQKWLRERMSRDDLGPRDLLIIAGDISHEISVLTESLQYMKQSGCKVFFVAGNHEAWLQKSDREILKPKIEGSEENASEATSLDKINYVYDTCKQLGVMVDPCLITSQNNSLWILPVQSWYDGSLSFSEQHCEGFAFWPWVDFQRCQWPRQFQQTPVEDSLATNHNVRMPVGLVEWILAQNTDNIHLIQKMIKQQIKEHRPKGSVTLLTVSHFLPNQQCLPDWVDLEASTLDVESCIDYGAAEMSAKFAKVAGSEKIDAQLRSILDELRNGYSGYEDSNCVRHMHVFGHSHRPKDFDYGGIRYIHNPLGKSRERLLHMIDPDVDFQLIWRTKATDIPTSTSDGIIDSSSAGEVPGRRVLRYWEEYGGGKVALWKRMEVVKPQRRYASKRIRTEHEKYENNNNISD